MASGSMTSWQIDWGKSGNTDRFYFLTLHNCKMPLDESERGE